MLLAGKRVPGLCPAARTGSLLLESLSSPAAPGWQRGALCAACSLLGGLGLEAAPDPASFLAQGADRRGYGAHPAPPRQVAAGGTLLSPPGLEVEAEEGSSGSWS